MTTAMRAGEAVPFGEKAVSQGWRVLHRSGILVPAAFLAGMARFAPLADTREFDTDEGVNLIKALLVGRGHALYTEIWDDQPPLLTAALAHWFNWFGSSVLAARVLVLLFAALLLWAFYQAVRRTVTEPAALAGVLLLLLSAYFVRLSISVMIGLPALALGTLAVYLILVAGQEGRTWGLVLSAVALALAMQIKLFAGLAAPAIATYLFLLVPPRPGASGTASLARRLRSVLVWVAVVVVTFGMVGLVFRSLDFGQLIVPHLGNQTRTAFSIADNLRLLEGTALRHAAYLPLAVTGVAWAIARRKLPAVLPGVWAATGLAFLGAESAVKYHHVLLLTIPLAWLCAYGVEACIWAFGRLGRAGGRGRLGQAALLITGIGLLWLAAYDPAAGQPRLKGEVLGGIDFNRRVVDLLCPRAGPDGTWVLADRPYYPFLAGKAVPPPAAVLTGKRLVSGALSEPGLLDIMSTYQPRYLVLERFLPEYSQEFLAAVAQRYEVAQAYRWGPEDQPGELLVARPAAGGARSAAVFDGWLQLGWPASSYPVTVTPGSCLDVQGLRWQRPEARPGGDLAVSLRLTSGDGQVIVQHDEQLGTDLNTLRDRPEITTFQSFYIPEGTPPGRYALSLVVYDPQTGTPLPAVTRDAGPRGSLDLGEVRVERPPAAPALRRAAADFGALRLISGEAGSGDARAGASLPVSLLWQAAPGYRPEAFVVVLQLLDGQGKVVAGLEEEPVRGRYPTTGWGSKELVGDQHELQIPSDTPPGTYDLIVGLYRATDRERLVTRSLFGLNPSDHVSIRKVRIS